jgi:hypothetical protein
MTRMPDHRSIPTVYSAALLDHDTGEIHAAGEVFSVEEFDEYVERDQVTRFEVDVPAGEDCCFLFREGEGPPGYVTLKEAAEHIKGFCEKQVREGDSLYREGRKLAALKFYELAGAAGQEPEYLARMLLCMMPDRRRERIEEALSQVATLDPPSLHVDEMRKKLEEGLDDDSSGH